MKYRYTKAQIVDALQRCAAEAGCSSNDRLTAGRFKAWSRGKTEPGLYDIYRHGQIGSWTKALKLAGLKATGNYPVEKAPEVIERSVKRAMELHGHERLTEEQYAAMFRSVDSVDISLSVVLRYFGSWDHAAEEMGFSPGRWRVNAWTEERVARVVRGVCGHKPLSARLFDSTRGTETPCSARLAKHFGGWQNVLRLSGYTDSEAKAALSERIAEANRARARKRRESAVK